MGRQVDHGHRLTEEDRFEIQQRVTAGEIFASAAAGVGCSTKSIQRFMARTGGMHPAAWNRSPRHLSLAEREELLRGLLAGDSFREIAARLGRAPSTISREVAGNGRRRRYSVSRAEDAAARHARRPKSYKRAPASGVATKIPGAISLGSGPTVGINTEIRRVVHEAVQLELSAIRAKIQPQRGSPAPATLDRSYSVAEVAVDEGVSVKTVRDWIKKGILLAAKAPSVKQYRVSESELTRYRATRCAPPEIDLDRAASTIVANALGPRRRG